MKRNLPRILIIFILGLGILGFSFYFNSPKSFDEEGKTSLKNNSPNQKAQPASFSFVVCGDSHANYEIYGKIVQKVNEIKPDFLVHLGDFSRVGAESEFKTFKNFQEKNLKVAYHLVMGNHEVLKNQSYFKKYFGPQYYSWDYRGVHFIVLDNVSSPLAFDKSQLLWLENDLKNTQAKLKFVFVHIPPGFPLASLEDLRLKEEAKPQLEKFGAICQQYQVTKIYAGHVHNYYQFNFHGVPLTITGGAGGPLNKIPFLAPNPKYHFLVVKVNQGEYTEEVVEVNY